MHRIGLGTIEKPRTTLCPRSVLSRTSRLRELFMDDPCLGGLIGYDTNLTCASLLGNAHNSDFAGIAYTSDTTIGLFFPPFPFLFMFSSHYCSHLSKSWSAVSTQRITRGQHLVRPAWRIAALNNLNHEAKTCIVLRQAFQRPGRNTRGWLWLYFRAGLQLRTRGAVTFL